MTELVIAMSVASLIFAATFYQSYQSKQRWKRFCQRDKQGASVD